MKSPVLATLGGLAVLGHAQQPTPHDANVSSALTPSSQESSGPPANATIAVADFNVQNKPVAVPLPTTVTTTYTRDSRRATCHTTVIAGVTRAFCNTPEPTQRGPLRKPHGSIHPYVPEEDISENPRIVVDPERACHKGYSCQPDGGHGHEHEHEHEPHGGVYRSGQHDGCGRNCRRDDRDCHTGCEVSGWTPPSGCHKRCRDGRCWDECSGRHSLPQRQPVCPWGFSCQKTKRKPTRSPTPTPSPTSSSTTSSRTSRTSRTRTRSRSRSPASSVASASGSAPAAPAPVVPASIFTTLRIPAVIVPGPFAPAPTTSTPCGASSSAPGAPAPPAPTLTSTPCASPSSAPGAPAPAPAPPAPAQPSRKCPAGMHPCPYRHANGTIPPPTVTRAGAGHVQAVAGVAMVIAGVFGMLMA